MRFWDSKEIRTHPHQCSGDHQIHGPRGHQRSVSLEVVRGQFLLQYNGALQWEFGLTLHNLEVFYISMFCLYVGRYYTDRCDVFSFGIMVWEMLARRRPTLLGAKGNNMAILYAMANGTYCTP